MVETRVATFYTADLHLGHVNIISFCSRPFASVGEMNEAIIDNWNACVSKYDRVYILGDLVLGKLDETLPLVELLNGTKFLVPGNHDRVFPQQQGRKPPRAEMFALYESVGLTLLPPQVTDLNGWTLCHFPDIEDELHATRDAQAQRPDRWAAWRPRTPRGGEILVHGHVHTAWKVRGNRVNVGVDMWDFYPVHENQIRAVIQAPLLNASA